MSSTNLNITILAGGLGKRMRSTLPKVLHKVAGKPMLVRILEEARKFKPTKIIIVVGQYIDVIKEVLSNHTDIQDVTFAIQQESLGTGDAVKSTLEHLDRNACNLILNGDTPLIKYETLKEAVENRSNSKIQITCISLVDPTGCGRIIVKEGVFEKIVEDKDCSTDEREVKLVNVGIYVVDTEVLLKYIPMIGCDNAQKEYYLTDLVKIYKDNEDSDVGLFELDSSKIVEISNVNTKEQLEELNLNYK
jgi:bifunctional UDP-N-acetylglucosamine pyrophosphorylase/glucosamine-1-phosphate N-acetyltransferase